MARSTINAPKLQSFVRPQSVLLHFNRTSTLTILSSCFPALTNIAGRIHLSEIEALIVIRSAASVARCMTMHMPYSGNRFVKCRSQASTFGFLVRGVRL